MRKYVRYFHCKRIQNLTQMKNFSGKIADKYMENLKQASGEI